MPAKSPEGSQPPPWSPSTAAFKVDIVWKIVLLGGLSLAGKLSWQAYEGIRQSIETLTDLTHTMDVRLSLVEDRSLRNERGLDGWLLPPTKHK